MDAAYTIVTLADPFSPNPVVREIGSFCRLILETHRGLRHPGAMIDQLRDAINRIRCIEDTVWQQYCEVPQCQVIREFEGLLRRFVQ